MNHATAAQTIPFFNSLLVPIAATTLAMLFTIGGRGLNLLVYRVKHALPRARAQLGMRSGAGMAKVTSIGVWLAIAGIALVAQGCREEEQNRPLLY